MINNLQSAINIIAGAYFAREILETFKICLELMRLHNKLIVYSTQIDTE